MNRIRKFRAVTVAITTVVAVLSLPAWAQVNSNLGNVVINARLRESMTVTVNNGATVSIPLSPNTAVNSGSNTTNATLSWSLQPGRQNIAIWAYFSSAASALVHQTPGNLVDIPSSAVQIQVVGITGFNPMTAVNPFNSAASGALLANIPINNGNLQGNVTGNLAYQINTTVVPQLPADNYIGILNLQAQATP